MTHDQYNRASLADCRFRRAAQYRTTPHGARSSGHRHGRLQWLKKPVDAPQKTTPHNDNWGFHAAHTARHHREYDECRSALNAGQCRPTALYPAHANLAQPTTTTHRPCRDLAPMRCLRAACAPHTTGHLQALKGRACPLFSRLGCADSHSDASGCGQHFCYIDHCRALKYRQTILHIFCRRAALPTA